MDGFLILVALVFGFALWHELHTRRRNAELTADKIRREKSIAEIERNRSLDEQEKAESELISFAAMHQHTLLKKQRQLIYTDDYGRVDRSSFLKELDYFVENVVPAHIRDPHVKHYEDSATIIMATTVQVFLLGVEQSAAEGKLSYTIDMPGLEFERLVGERLAIAGAVVRFTPASGDQGADLIVEYDGETIVVQCKRSASTVGNKAVQEAFAGRAFHNAEHAWVISDAPFSRAARQLASSLSVRLVDFADVDVVLVSR